MHVVKSVLHCFHLFLNHLDVFVCTFEFCQTIMAYRSRTIQKVDNLFSGQTTVLQIKEESLVLFLQLY